MTLTTQDLVDSDQNFVYYARIRNGVVFDVVTGDDGFAKIEDRMAKRTSDINGDFFINPFIVNYEDDSNDANLIATVSEGLAYVSDIE